jgi:hypothetical protein
MELGRKSVYLKKIVLKGSSHGGQPCGGHGGVEDEELARLSERVNRACLFNSGGTQSLPLS